MLSLLLALAVLSLARSATLPLYPHVLVPTNRTCDTTAQCIGGQNWCHTGQTCLRGRCHLVPNYPCPYFQHCNARARQCVPRLCRRFSDCDDGLFCNGVEQCVNATCTSDFAHDCTGGTCSEERKTCSLPLELQERRRNLTRLVWYHGTEGYTRMVREALSGHAATTRPASGKGRIGADVTPTVAPTGPVAPTVAPTNGGFTGVETAAIVASVIVIAVVVFILLIIALISR